MSGLTIHSGGDYSLVAIHGMLHTGANIKFSENNTTNFSSSATSNNNSLLNSTQQQSSATDNANNTTDNTNTNTNTVSAIGAPPAPKLLSVVGNNISLINLQRNSTQTLPCCNSSIACFDVSPDGDLIFAVGNKGIGVFYSISAGLALDTVSIPPQCPCRIAVFSPNGKFVALGADTTLQIYAAPAERTVSFHGCTRVENVHNAVNEAITHIEWTQDSECVLLSGADARIRIYPRDVRNRIGWAAAVNNLIGHRAPVVGAFWAEAPSQQTSAAISKMKNQEENENEKDDEDDKFSCSSRCISVSTDNVVIEWHRSHLRRKEVMEMIWQLKRRSQLQKKKKKKNSKKNNLDGAENAENEDEEDEDESESDEEVVPQSFLEKQKQSQREAEGVPEEAVQHHVSKGDDAHLHPSLRYAFETHKRHLLQHKGQVASAAYHRKRSLLALGYTSGLFAIHAVLINDNSNVLPNEDALPKNFNTDGGEQQAAVKGTTTDTSLPLLHVLSATAQSLSTAAFSPRGDLIAFGSSHLKQLLVWDWRSETHVLKEQSHYYDISCSTITSDGALIISGGDDGKAKVWRRSNGQCVASFAEHTGGISGITCSPATSAFFTASRDGTCRGFDLVRYRNFRVFQPSEACQFSCIVVDSSGEVLAAGSATTGLITIWSVQTGKIVEEFSGHEGPITTLSFHSSGSTLYSGAVDKTLMVWDLFSTANAATQNQGQALKSDSAESLTVSSEVLSTSCAMNGSRFASLLLNGELQVYDSTMPTELVLVTSFSTNFEAAGGWVGKVGPKSANSSAHFTTIALSPDGKKVLAAGESRWIALFHADQGYLLHKWPVTTNADILGVSEQFDYRGAVSDNGDSFMVGDVQVEDADAHLTKRKLIEMPGSKHSHFATGKRKTEITARTMHVAFAGHGRDFVAATTVGLLLFSADAVREKFAPLSLRRDLTTASVLKMLRGTTTTTISSTSSLKNKNIQQQQKEQQHVVEGLIGALILQDERLIQEGLRRVPPSSVAFVCDSVPTAAFSRLLRSVADAVNNSDALEHAILWAKNVLLFTNEPLFGPLRSDEVALPLRQLHKAINNYENLRSAFNENEALLGYLSGVVNRRNQRDAVSSSSSKGVELAVKKKTN